MNPRSPKLKIVVTEELIAAAKVRDSGHCMNAEALKAAFPTADRIAVDLQTIRFTDPKKRLRYSYLTPRIAQIALLRWDQGLKVEPFTFTLRSAHVTMSNPNPHHGSKAHASYIANESRRNNLKKARMVNRSKQSGRVVERVGGKTPPLMGSKERGVPFTRRRAFGLRAMEL